MSKFEQEEKAPAVVLHHQRKTCDEFQDQMVKMKKERIGDIQAEIQKSNIENDREKQ